MGSGSEEWGVGSGASDFLITDSPLPTPGLNYSTPCATLEVNPQTEFYLPRGIRLSGDVAERLWSVYVQARRAGLEMVQDIGELRQECHAHTLGELELFGDAQVQVPLGQVVDATGATAIVVEAENQPPELPIDFIRVIEHVDARAASGRVGVQPDRP